MVVTKPSASGLYIHLSFQRDVIHSYLVKAKRYLTLPWILKAQRRRKPDISWNERHGECTAAQPRNLGRKETKGDDGVQQHIRRSVQALQKPFAIGPFACL